MRIDVQCHTFPPIIGKYFLENPFPKCIRLDEGFLFDFGSQKLMLPDYQYAPRTIVSAMDQGKVDISLVSANIPDAGFLPVEKAVPFCTELNEAIKEIIDQYNDRFVGMGVLPWNDPMASIKELENVKALGFKGIMLFTRSGEMQVDDRRLEPVYSACEEAGLPLFLHPTVPMWHEPIGDYGMVATVSFVMDTAYAFLRLCHSGVLDRHPKLKLVIPHAGGVLPILDGRLGYVPPASRKYIDPNKRTVIDTLFSEQVWFDLANPSIKVLEYFKEYLGFERAMYGTDYPFVDQYYMTDLIEKMDITDEDKEKINWKNAARLFDLKM